MNQPVNILLFGQLSELAGGSSMQLDHLPDSASLIAELETRFPGLKTFRYRVAINQQLVTGNTLLQGGCTVALLPPFSGG